MNTITKTISLTVLVSTALCVADATTSVTPFMSYRSQSQDLARQMVGCAGYEYKYDMDKHYWNFAFTPEYTQSFHNNDITHDLFGCWYLQDCNTLNIVGTQAASFDSKSLAAEWFDLPSDYVGSVCFDPVVKNVNADLHLYWGMDEWVQGLFLRIHAPLTWTKWDLGAKFATATAGITAGVDATYLDNAEKFFCKKETLTTDAYTPLSLNCARFCGCSCDDNKTLVRLADIQTDIGWNFILDQDYHLGMFARIVAPTGNKIRGEWLFEPTIGNGHRWELGVGLTGNAIVWRNKDESKNIGFFVEADVTHLFNAKQNRVFDLKNKPLSRYVQAYKVEGAVTTYSPLANLTSCALNVNVEVQADIVALLNYTCHNWSYDLGYNFWARSCEKFDCKNRNSCSNNCNDCNACCGQCIIKNGTEEWFIFSNDSINSYFIGSEERVTNAMIDYDGARTKGISNKVFAHVNYAWMEREVVPFFGLGGFAEFGKNESCCNDSCNSCDSCNDTCNACDNNCSCCKNVSLSQWGLWLKGGVSF